VNDLPGLDLLECGVQLVKNWLEPIQPVVEYASDDDAEFQSAQVALIGELAVNGYENVKPHLSEFQEGRIFHTAPPALGHSLDSVTWKCSLEAGWDTLI